MPATPVGPQECQHTASVPGGTPCPPGKPDSQRAASPSSPGMSRRRRQSRAQPAPLVPAQGCQPEHMQAGKSPRPPSAWDFLPYREQLLAKRELHEHNRTTCCAPRFEDEVLEQSWLALRERTLQELAPWGWVATALCVIQAAAVVFALVEDASVVVPPAGGGLPVPVRPPMDKTSNAVFVGCLGVLPMLVGLVVLAFMGRGFEPDGVSAFAGEVEYIAVWAKELVPRSKVVPAGGSNHTPRQSRSEVDSGERDTAALRSRRRKAASVSASKQALAQRSLSEVPRPGSRNAPIAAARPGEIAPSSSARLGRQADVVSSVGRGRSAQPLGIVPGSQGDRSSVGGAPPITHAGASPAALSHGLEPAAGAGRASDVVPDDTEAGASTAPADNGAGRCCEPCCARLPCVAAVLCRVSCCRCCRQSCTSLDAEEQALRTLAAAAQQASAPSQSDPDSDDQAAGVARLSRRHYPHLAASIRVASIAISVSR